MLELGVNGGEFVAVPNTKILQRQKDVEASNVG